MIYTILVFFLILCIPLVYLMIKYRNPYKLIMVFGKKGSGKTTYLCKLAQDYIAKGRPVYTTENIPGTYHIDARDVGFVQFPEESVLLIDEVGMIWDNRDYKNFKNEVRDYFKLQRHYHHTVYLFSQTFDIDLKLRNLTDRMYMLVNIGGFLTYGKEIRRKLVVVKPGEQSESRIADELVIPPWFLFIFGARFFVWIPKYSKFFNSYAAPQLKEKTYKLVEYPDHVPDRLLPKRKRKAKIYQRGYWTKKPKKPKKGK